MIVSLIISRKLHDGVIDKIFGPRITRMNNSEYFEDSPVMKFLRATEVY